jgi:hypothetical protein
MTTAQENLFRKIALPGIVAILTLWTYFYFKRVADRRKAAGATTYPVQTTAPATVAEKINTAFNKTVAPVAMSDSKRLAGWLDVALNISNKLGANNTEVEQMELNFKTITDLPYPEFKAAVRAWEAARKGSIKTEYKKYKSLAPVATSVFSFKAESPGRTAFFNRVIVNKL